jgi:hypothetical protein
VEFLALLDQYFGDHLLESDRSAFSPSPRIFSFEEGLLCGGQQGVFPGRQVSQQRP